MKPRRKTLDYLAYLALRVVSAVFLIFPIEANLRAMRCLGWLWFHLPHALPEARVPAWLAWLPATGRAAKASITLNRLLLRFREHRNRAELHIRQAFPQFTPRRVRAVALASMQQLAMLAIEVLQGQRLLTRWTWARHVRLGKIDEALRVLLGTKGCIMLTGHYGNWELLGYTLALLGFDIVAVMRPLDNEYLNHYLLDSREKSGLKLLYKKGATRSAEEVINGGGALCFIADQNAGSKGLFVDFFGRKASTYKSIGLLAIEHEVPIIVGCARRTSPRFEYEVVVNRIIRPHEWKGREDELMWITQEYTRALEELVRAAPEQYLWIHRRWKSRPREERAASGLAAADSRDV